MSDRIDQLLFGLAIPGRLPIAPLIEGASLRVGNCRLKRTRFHLFRLCMLVASAGGNRYAQQGKNDGLAGPIIGFHERLNVTAVKSDPSPPRNGEGSIFLHVGVAEALADRSPGLFRL